jgi:nucleoside-diphosphate-sugar epimerase
MKVLLTGATGFTGGFVVRELLARGVPVRCLVRNPEKARILPPEVEVVSGDMGDDCALEKAFRGIQRLINVASLGFGHAPAIVRSAQRAKVERAVFVSTTSVFTQLNAPSKSVRLSAESEVTNSGLNYVLFRPTMIYGTSGDRNISRLIRYLHKFSVIPVFGTGNYLQQPVYVGDLASVICQAGLGASGAMRAFNVSGAAPLSYNEVISTVGKFLGKKVTRIHLPVPPIISFLRLMEKFRLKLPIKAEQVLRLNENKAFDHTEASAEFGFAPRSFEEGVKLEIEEMGLMK